METHTNGVAYAGVESKFKELHPVTSTATPYTVLPTPYTVLLCPTLYSSPSTALSLLSFLLSLAPDECEYFMSQPKKINSRSECHKRERLRHLWHLQQLPIEL